MSALSLAYLLATICYGGTDGFCVCVDTDPSVYCGNYSGESWDDYEEVPAEDDGPVHG